MGISMSMLDFIMAAAAVPTKREFGRIMHDDNKSEEEKQLVLEAVERAGGYDNLAD